MAFMDQLGIMTNYTCDASEPGFGEILTTARIIQVIDLMNVHRQTVPFLCISLNGFSVYWNISSLLFPWNMEPSDAVQISITVNHQ